MFSPQGLTCSGDTKSTFDQVRQVLLLWLIYFYFLFHHYILDYWNKYINL